MVELADRNLSFQADVSLSLGSQRVTIETPNGWLCYVLSCSGVQFSFPGRGRGERGFGCCHGEGRGREGSGWAGWLDARSSYSHD